MLESLLSLASPRGSDQRNPSLMLAVLFHTLLVATLWALSLRAVALVEQTIIHQPLDQPVAVRLGSFDSRPPPAGSKPKVEPARPAAPQPTQPVPETAVLAPELEPSDRSLSDPDAPSIGAPEGLSGPSDTTGTGSIGAEGHGSSGAGDATGVPGPGQVDPCELTPCVIDGSISAPVAIAQPEPEYPRVMIHARLEGKVELEIVIGTRGEVESVLRVSGNEPFASAAEQAVKRWRYRPAERAGVPIRIVQRVIVRFQLR